MSINIGGLYCIQCCGVHRHLGTHYSKMRSTKLDDLEPEIYLLQARIGNRSINAVYQPIESHLPPPDDIPDDTREIFIRSKYVDKTFAYEGSKIPIEKHCQLFLEACENDYIPKMLFHMVHGADVNYADPKTGNRAIHIAAMKGLTLVIAFLALNNADLNCKNAEGYSPLHFAAENNCVSAVAMLLKYGANPELANNDGKKPGDVVVASQEISALLREGGASKKNVKIVLAQFFGDMEKNIFEQSKKPTGLQKVWISACPKQSGPLSPSNNFLSN